MSERPWSSVQAYGARHGNWQDKPQVSRLALMGDNSTALNESTTLSENIAWHMGEVLARPPLEPTDDFFLCGGDSLLAVQLISRLIDSHRPAEQAATEQLESALLMAVFDDATPDGLAKIIEPRPS